MMPSTDRNEHLFQKASVAHCVASADGRIVGGNENALTLFGYTRSEFEGLHILTPHDSSALDVTPRKDAERALQEREHLLRTLLNRVPGAVYLTPPDGRMVEVNDPAVELTGFSRDEFEGARLCALLAGPEGGAIGAHSYFPDADDLTLSAKHLAHPPKAARGASAPATRSDGARGIPNIPIAPAVRSWRMHVPSRGANA